MLVCPDCAAPALEITCAIDERWPHSALRTTRAVFDDLAIRPLQRLPFVVDRGFEARLAEFRACEPNPE